MHILLVKGPGVGSLKLYEQLLKKRLVTFETRELDKPLSWKNGNPDSAQLEAFCADVYKSRAESVDAVMFFVDPDDWHPTNKRLLGRHYNRRRSGYQVSITKYDTRRNSKYGRRWVQTADHEFMHKLDNIVRIYLGLRIEGLVGVGDWDDDVVHGGDRRYTRYEHETPYQIVYPMLKKAVEKRRRSYYLGILEKLMIQLREIQINLQRRDHIITEPAKTTADKIYDHMLTQVGIDASPADLAPDELGCAETVSTILKKIIPSIPVIPGTWTLWDYFRKSSLFMLVDDPQPGDIVISPTGTSKFGSRRPFVGHTGFIGNRRKIYSNDSYKGTFEQNYTIDSWIARYEKKGGYPIYYFRAK